MTRAVGRGASTVPLHPVLVAAASVVNAWREAGMTLDQLPRPLLVATVGTGLMTVLFGLAPRIRWMAAALFATLALILVTKAPLEAAIPLVERFAPVVAAVWLALGAGAVIVGCWIVWQFVRQPDGWPRLTVGMNTFGAFLLAVVLATAVTDGSVAFALRAGSRPGTVDSPSTVAAASTPDIYVLLLDAYPRADTLEAVFDFDNRAFTDGLHDLGFEVATASQSNYMFTQLTLASMLQMRLLDDQPPHELVYGEATLGRGLELAIAENPTFTTLRRHGYEIIATSAGYDAAALRTADRYIDSGEVSGFERHLIRRTVVIDILDLFAHDWLPDQLRSRVRSSLRQFTELAAEPHDRPRFVFVHVPSPHSPNLFAADGSALPIADLHRFQADSPQGAGISVDEFVAQARGQVAYISDVALEAVDVLLAAAQRQTVVLVLSDHGTRVHVTFGDPDDPDIGERFANFFAASTPGKDGLFGDGITPVNVFPILFNAYLGEDLPCRPDAIYATGPGGYLDLQLLPDRVGASNPACGREVPLASQP